MPRQPQFGQGEGAVAPISSDVYEMYAPQMAMTDFQTDSARTAYELEKDIEFEKQAQIDSSIAQSKFATDERKRGAEKEAKKAEKGRKVSAATTGATVGFQLGGPLGAALGGLGGWLFGEEGGYVPSIHPRSMLFKEYQQGGNVMGYTGEGKFLRRGLQNLQMRQDDLSRLTENVDKMGKYGFWDAAMDAGRGYMAGKALAPKAESLLNLAKSSYGLAKEKGIGAVWDVLSGKTTGLPDPVKIWNIEAPSSLELPQRPQTDISKIIHGAGLPDKATFLKDAGVLHRKKFPHLYQSPARETALGMSPFKKAFRDARKSNKNTFDYEGKMYTTELA